MSSGTRRLNYTKRRRISRKQALITMSDAHGDDPPIFNADINLSGLKFPGEARVFVDVYRHTAWQRFDFGTVKSIQAPDNRALLDFGAGEGVRFRVKVVEPHSSNGRAARILGQADGITPDHAGRRRSLLPLDPDPNLRDEVWRLDIDERDGPLVRVSTHLVRDRHALARSPAFVSLALPEILRRILLWALADGLPDDDDWETPQGQWILLACRLLKVPSPPQTLDNQADGSDAREDWVDKVVSRFCQNTKIHQKFSGWWTQGATAESGGVT